jgi:hypothetical protein
MRVKLTDFLLLTTGVFSGASMTLGYAAATSSFEPRSVPDAIALTADKTPHTPAIQYINDPENLSL